MSPKFQSNLKLVALMSNMIKAVMTSRVSILQVALGLEVQEKRLIEHLFEYRVTSSYDEVRRLRICTAFSAGQSPLLKFTSKEGLSKEYPITLMPIFVLKMAFNRHIPEHLLFFSLLHQMMIR